MIACFLTDVYDSDNFLYVHCNAGATSTNLKGKYVLIAIKNSMPVPRYWHKGFPCYLKKYIILRISWSNWSSAVSFPVVYLYGSLSVAVPGGAAGCAHSLLYMEVA